MKLVTALAKYNNIPVIHVDERNELGEWLGHCKYDKEGAARKVKGTSSVCIKDYGEESEALSFVLNHIKEHGLWTWNPPWHQYSRKLQIVIHQDTSRWMSDFNDLKVLILNFWFLLNHFINNVLSGISVKIKTLRHIEKTSSTTALLWTVHFLTRLRLWLRWRCLTRPWIYHNNKS